MAALVEHGSCFAGLLAELLFSVDRTYMMDGEFEGDNRHIATIILSSSNLGTMPMANGLSRLATRFLGEPETLAAVEASVGITLDADAARNHGLVTFAYDAVSYTHLTLPTKA